MRVAVPRADVRRLGVFGQAAGIYWGQVFPLVQAELRRWRVEAGEIEDEVLRRLALRALAKRANIEGAAAFATFVPAQRRRDAVRAMTCFQIAYNHLDLLSEQPGAVGSRAQALHAALPAALIPQERSPAWSVHLHDHEDGGYLAAIVQGCRDALCSLPSYGHVQDAALRAARRVVCFQALNCSVRRGDLERVSSWARAHAIPDSGLTWWETAAAAGSSLGVFAMLALAAQPSVEAAHVDAIERLYFPSVGALHSMLDQLVDVEEDERTGQNNLLLCYHSAEETARRMGALAREAIAQAEALQPRSEAIRHSLIVAAMAAMYLAAPESRAPHVLDARSAVLRELGPLARLAIGVFRLSGRDGGPERAPDPAAALESQASESPLVGERGLCEVAAGR